MAPELRVEMASEGRHFAVHAMICRQIWNLTCYALRESYVDGASLTRLQFQPVTKLFS